MSSAQEIIVLGHVVLLCWDLWCTQAIRKAAEKVKNGGSMEDAKRLCPKDLFMHMLKTAVSESSAFSFYLVLILGVLGRSSLPLSRDLRGVILRATHDVAPDPQPLTSNNGDSPEPLNPIQLTINTWKEFGEMQSAFGVKGREDCF